MMSFIRAHKFHLISISAIFGLFLWSVHLRNEKIHLDLSPEFEWITAHTLITLEVWEEGGGPSKFGFNPIYSYSGKGSKKVSSLGGVMDENGDMYYVSYPPFAFIFAYYATKVLGGNNVANLRSVGLIIHFFCALLVYFVLFSLRQKNEDHFSLAALLGSVLYLFSSGLLWAHSILYFSDILIQLLLLLNIFLLIKIWKQNYAREWLILTFTGLITFLSVYTEWLGLLFAFLSGVMLLILYFNSKKKIFLKSFFIIGITASISLSVTMVQYASIAGFDVLMDVSQSKYEERSGQQKETLNQQNYNWQNPKSFEIMEGNLNRNFPMVINLVPIILIVLIPVLLWRKSRNKMKGIKWKLLLVTLLFLSVLAHYLLFFNFNAIHNFSNLKTGLLMILFIGVVASIIEESLNWKMNLLFAGLILYLIIPRIIRDYNRYDKYYQLEDFNLLRDQSAKTIRENRHPDKFVFTTLDPSPEYIYKCHHNIFPVSDTASAAAFMGFFDVDYAQYYHHQNDSVQFMLELERDNGQVRTVKRINF